MRLFAAALLATLALSGCARIAEFSHFSPLGETQVLFLQVLDGDDRARQTEAFRELKEQHPEDPWTHRAIVLEAQREARQKNQADLSWHKKELSRCRQDCQRLEAENRQLIENRNEIKKLIIEMETLAR